MSAIIPNRVPFHEHIFIGSTDLTNEHKHSFSGVTGPEIPLPECSGLGHIHEIHVTHCSFLFMHSHRVKGITGPPIWLSENEHYHILDGMTEACTADEHVHPFSGMTRSHWE